MPVEITENRFAEVRAAQHRGFVAAFTAGAEATRAQEVADCPVSGEEYPGKTHLIETIERTPDGQIEQGPDRLVAEVKVGDPSQGVDYAGYVVLGTSRQAPQDFVGPAYETGRRELLRGVG